MHHRESRAAAGQCGVDAAPASVDVCNGWAMRIVGIGAWHEPSGPRQPTPCVREGPRRCWCVAGEGWRVRARNEGDGMASLF